MTEPDVRPDNIGAAYRAIDPEATDAEVYECAARWLEEEDTDTFFIGCTNFSTARATVYAIEAARCLCQANNNAARRLLTMALEELDRVMLEELGRS